jgi:hypothetical protein
MVEAGRRDEVCRVDKDGKMRCEGGEGVR